MKNLHIKEESNSITVNWDDIHFDNDPIEFVVFCNSSQDSMRRVGRNKTYVCDQMSFNDTNMISVETRIAVPGYTHDQVVVKMNSKL